MSSVFVSLCFVKSVSGSQKCISGNAVYRVNESDNDFREIEFKGYNTSPESMVSELEKGSIALIVGRYVYEDMEYVS